MSTRISTTESTGRRHCYAERATRYRLCHAFLVSSKLSAIGRSHSKLGRFTAHDPDRRRWNQSLSQRTRFMDKMVTLVDWT